jgi:hypothetical protein
LLFATLQAVRRKEGPGADAQADAASTTVAAEPQPQADTAPAASTDLAISDTYGTPSGEATGTTDAPADTTDVLEETPEWEPHAAARTTPDEVVPETTPDEVEPPLATDTPPEEIWAEPTPTAMSDAAALEDATSSTSEEQRSFSRFLDDEPSAATTESVESSDTDAPFTTSAEEPFTTEEPQTETRADLYASPAAEAERAASLADDVPDDVPEEEPFERAGRWWFKRGSELLVYNEQSGEWVPSPTPLPNVEQPAAARFGPDSSATHTITDVVSVQAEPEPQPEPEIGTESEPQLVEPTAQQGFWRCPACGAVNGSTAETCRMCFAARPAAGA